MVTITYSLTPQDLAELEAERRGGLLRRSARIAFGAWIGFIGFFLACQAIFFFPWNHWFGNLVIAGLGLFLMWIGFELPGLRWLCSRFSDPYAPQELRIYEGKIASSCGGKTRQFRWTPKRGFKENDKFFLLRAFPSEAKWAVPKRAVNLDQEQELRGLVQQEPVRGHLIECRFLLTQEELSEASQNLHPWLYSRYGKLLTRAVCGAGALFVLLVPRLTGSSWAQELRTEPMVAASLIGFELFVLWAASGCLKLRALNRLDLERKITLSDLDVEAAHGAKTSTYKWSRLFSYCETEHLFVLRPHVTVQFWTVPKRALSSAEQEKLRSLLDRKLPKQ
jgi:hypothetical protein